MIVEWVLILIAGNFSLFMGVYLMITRPRYLREKKAQREHFCRNTLKRRDYFSGSYQRGVQGGLASAFGGSGQPTASQVQQAQNQFRQQINQGLGNIFNTDEEVETIRQDAAKHIQHEAAQAALRARNNL